LPSIPRDVQRAGLESGPARPGTSLIALKIMIQVPAKLKTDARY
jgi:hypothetical protein